MHFKIESVFVRVVSIKSLARFNRSSILQVSKSITVLLIKYRKCAKIQLIPQKYHVNPGKITPDVEAKPQCFLFQPSARFYQVHYSLIIV